MTATRTVPPPLRRGAYFLPSLFTIGNIFLGFFAIVLAVTLLFVELFPRVMVSSTDFAWSLTTSNASSSHYTLVFMTIVALVMTPVVLLYQGWTYYVFRARLGQVEPVKNPIDLLAEKGVL